MKSYHLDGFEGHGSSPSMISTKNSTCMLAPKVETLGVDPGMRESPSDMRLLFYRNLPWPERAWILSEVAKDCKMSALVLGLIPHRGA